MTVASRQTKDGCGIDFFWEELFKLSIYYLIYKIIFLFIYSYLN